MTTAKIEFSLGGLSFSAEGTEAWLAAQLDKVIEAAPKLGQLKVHAPPAQDPAAAGATAATPQPDGEFTTSLAAYIKEKGGDTNQNKRFLATADWLRRRGMKPLTTGAVSKALTQNHQKKLGNPADCLGQLTGRGLCEKTSEGFFITPDGLKELGRE